MTTPPGGAGSAGDGRSPEGGELESAALARNDRYLRQFIRRSPDPTIQLVRASLLRSVRADKEGGSKFVDAGNMTLEQLMAVTSPLGLSDLIAEENLGTLEREGPDRIEAQLSDLRRRPPP